MLLGCWSFELSERRILTLVLGLLVIQTLMKYQKQSADFVSGDQQLFKKFKVKGSSQQSAPALIPTEKTLICFSILRFTKKGWNLARWMRKISDLESAALQGEWMMFC